MNTKCTNCGVVHNVKNCPNCGSPAAPEMINCKFCQSQIFKKATVCPFCRRKQKSGALSIILIITASIFTFFLICIFVVGIINSIIVNSDDATSTVISSSIMEPETSIKPGTDETEETVLNIGDKITSEDMEVTINKIEFSYDVLPDNTSSFYSHYEADDGNVYIHIDTDVKNLSKQNLNCDEILSVIADYNNGYSYDGQAIVEDDTTGFTYALISSIDPLKTQGVHYIISCPEEVVESEKPLFLAIRLHGTNDTYKYIIRN